MYIYMYILCRGAGGTQVMKARVSEEGLEAAGLIKSSSDAKNKLQRLRTNKFYAQQVCSVLPIPLSLSRSLFLFYFSFSSPLCSSVPPSLHPFLPPSLQGRKRGITRGTHTQMHKKNYAHPFASRCLSLARARSQNVA